MELFSSEIEQDDARLRRGGGGFRSRALEAAFEAERLPDTRRHARLLFAFSALINTCFLAVDWRFLGTPHFWLAVPARLAVVATALACLALVRRDAGAARVRRTLIGWMVATALGVALLVTSRSMLAQFVVIILPVAYYLAIPVSFRWSLAGGSGCSLLLLTGYCWTVPISVVELGLVLAVIVLNVALGMVSARVDRHMRNAWASARAARRLGDALAVSRAGLARIFLASPVPLVLTAADDAGRVRALSRSAAALLGETDPATLHQYYAPAGLDPLRTALAMDGGTTEMEVTAMLGGSARTLLLKAATIDLPGERAILTGILDITERKAVQVNLEQIASTDALTGLRNRLSFFGAARAEMTRALRLRAALCLLMIDVDHFKAINDTHGHRAGDAVLARFAAICTETLGADAIVGRLGGEEFGVLLPDRRSAARLRAERLREAIAVARTPFGDAHIAITISIGLARVLPAERDLDQALARADFALYAAKRAGRNRIMTDEETDWSRATG